LRQLRRSSVSVIVDLDTPIRSSPDEVDLAIENVEAAVFFCHGRKDALIHRSNLLTDSTRIRGNGRIVMLVMACSSAKELGPAAILNGIRAYLGFREKVYFVNPIYSSHEKLVGRAWNKGVKLFLTKNYSISEIEEIIKLEFSKIIDSYRSPGRLKNEQDSALAFAWAHWNAAHMHLEGDGGALVNGSRKGLLSPRFLLAKRPLLVVLAKLTRFIKRI